MRTVTKKYSNGEVTVVWKSQLCNHATICFTELPEVFDPLERPWININGATSQRIIDTVKKCPTGALSYFMNDKDDSIIETIQQEAEYVKVEIINNGPLLINGKIIIKYPDNCETVKDGITSFCRCGKSAKAPFCDGSHLDAGFKD